MDWHLSWSHHRSAAVNHQDIHRTEHLMNDLTRAIHHDDGAGWWQGQLRHPVGVGVLGVARAIHIAADLEGQEAGIGRAAVDICACHQHRAASAGKARCYEQKNSTQMKDRFAFQEPPVDVE